MTSFCTNFENLSVPQTMKRYRECKKDVPVDHSLEGKDLQVIPLASLVILLYNLRLFTYILCANYTFALSIELLISQF